MKIYNFNNEDNEFDKIPTEADPAAPMKLVSQCRDQFVHRIQQQQFVTNMNKQLNQ